MPIVILTLPDLESLLSLMEVCTMQVYNHHKLRTVRLKFIHVLHQVLLRTLFLPSIILHLLLPLLRLKLHPWLHLLLRLPYFLTFRLVSMLLAPFMGLLQCSLLSLRNARTINNHLDRLHFFHHHHLWFGHRFSCLCRSCMLQCTFHVLHNRPKNLG